MHINETEFSGDVGINRFLDCLQRLAGGVFRIGKGDLCQIVFEIVTLKIDVHRHCRDYRDDEDE